MRTLHAVSLAAVCGLFAAACGSDSSSPNEPAVPAITVSDFLPTHNALRAALQDIVAEKNGGLGFDMWATILDRNGKVVDVVFSGETRGDQWPGSRVISAQKANSANAFSLEGFALSTANLFAAVQPGGSLFGLQESNPVDTRVAYAGPVSAYGKADDPMIGKRIGGINVFGGGFALYSPSGTLLGGLGVSGDTSCSDHIIGWKLRHALNLDNVPAGVAGAAPGTDNIIFTVDELDGFEHPTCFDANPEAEGEHVDIANALPETHPVGHEE
jgi:uncharacterized protein GlcG (DUF336 family)